MKSSRRTFIQQTPVAMAAAANVLKEYPVPSPGFKAPGYKLTVLATNWGFSGTPDAFCAKVKSDGYDGIEIWAPRDDAARDTWMNALHKHNLSFGFLAGVGTADPVLHRQEFAAYLEQAVQMKPLFVNCHSGRDYFSFDQNRAIIDDAVKISKGSGIPVYHETHRARILFAAHITREFIRNISDLRLTLDISHWCNVHHSLLADQPESVALALQRTDHVHSRIGHDQSAQVTDPRAPEWANAVKAHFEWWDQVARYKMEKGEVLTMTTEFGPPTYMPTVPYTGQPLADQWAINVHMMQLWRERY